MATVTERGDTVVSDSAAHVYWTVIWPGASLGPCAGAPRSHHQEGGARAEAYASPGAKSIFHDPPPARLMSEDQPEKKKRKPNPALMKPVQPDEVLAVVVGSTPIPRSEITKKLWDYIKSKGLQNPEKKTEIIADDALKAVFGGKERVTMFEMTKLVSQHIQG